jgi:uncharacterized damage-inducible protein DinB
VIDGIRFSELLDYSAEETEHWKRWFLNNADALELPIDVANAGTVRKLLEHIFLVELHFANAVSGAGIDLNPLQQKIKSGDRKSIEDLFAISEEATEKYREYLSKTGAEELGATVDLGSRLGIKASKRKLITQALTHSMRHWAQLSTALRQQGRKTDWVHDFLMSSAMA